MCFIAYKSTSTYVRTVAVVGGVFLHISWQPPKNSSLCTSKRGSASKSQLVVQQTVFLGKEEGVGMVLLGCATEARVHLDYVTQPCDIR